MNAIHLLKNDHQQIIAVIDQLESALAAKNDRCDEYFQKFKEEFNKHDEIEDKIFYPALSDYNRLEKLVRKGYQAHHAVEVTLLELKVISYKSDSWEPKFLVLKDSLLSHMNEEETILFPEISLVLTEEQLNQLGEKIIIYKNN